MSGARLGSRHLAAGLAIGPFGLGFFHNAQSIIHVAELGVVLFLFIIGLEMQPSRLWAMRGEIFGLGLLQVGLAIAVLVWVGILLGYPTAASFVAGTGFVLTSTAIVMQMLQERGETGLPKGRRIIAILLLEDLAIVPLLALVAFLAPGGAEATIVDHLTGVAIGLAAIAVLVLAGRYLLDPMFRLLARFGAREVMTAAALLVVLGAAVLIQAGGLSMAMGAFLAGVLLSESSFRHQLEADVEPFRGLLLGLFFLGVGMALDLNIIAANWVVIAISVPAFMILKMAVIYSVARFLRADNREAIERTVLMSQGGEFAFLPYATATQFGILTPEWNANLTAIIIISMVLTPLMIILHDRLLPKTAQSMWLRTCRAASCSSVSDVLAKSSASRFWRAVIRLRSSRRAPRRSVMARILGSRSSIMATDRASTFSTLPVRKMRRRSSLPSMTRRLPAQSQSWSGTSFRSCLCWHVRSTASTLLNWSTPGSTTRCARPSNPPLC